MSARPREPREAPDPDADPARSGRAARDDDPVRRSAQTGDDPQANPQAAEDRGGRPRAARERDLRFGLLPALLLSLAAHAAAIEALNYFGVGLGGDSPPRLALRGTGALGEPGGGGDAVRISIRYGDGAPAGASKLPASESATSELVVMGEPRAEPAKQIDPTEVTERPTPAQQPPREEPVVAQELAPVVQPAVRAAPDDVIAVPAFAAAPVEDVAPVESAVQVAPVADAAPPAAPEPVATLGEWEGPPVPAGWTADADPSNGALVAALAALAGGEGQGGSGAGEGNGSNAGDAALAGGGSGAGAGGGRGDGPGGQNGNGVIDANPLAGNEAPDYPLEARRAGEEGVVLVGAHVGADGAVASVELLASCGFERLDRSALDAVATWTYEPARRNGRAIAQDINVPIRFRLQPR